MPKTEQRVSVIYAKENSEDRRLAEDFRNELADLARVELLNIDKVAEYLPDNRFVKAALIGIPVFILSDATTTEARRRNALVLGNPILGDLKFRSYYVCRGVTRARFLERHPELSELFTEAMIVDEDAKASLIADLREYIHSRHDYIHSHFFLAELLRTTVNSLPFLALMPARLMGRIGALLFVLGIPAGIVLLVLATLRTGQPISSIPFLICLCAAGWALHEVESLEIWPWLGPRWRPRPNGRGADSNGSTFQPSDLDAALSRFREARRWAAIYGSIVLGSQLGPLLFVAFTGDTPPFSWMLAAGLFGVVTHLSATWAYHVAAHFEASRRGLHDGTLKRSERHLARLDITPIPDRLTALDLDKMKLFDEHESLQIRRWVAVASLGSTSAVHRPWLRPRDSVFISYVWGDDPEMGVAREISSALDRLGMQHFLDKRHISSGFVGWRSNVALELYKATHVILVVSPNIIRGSFIVREIREIMHRWHFELLPSVVCVVEPDVAANLRGDATVSLELRFLLTWCPRMTFAEAQDIEVLGHLLRQRRRNGRFRDWWVLLSGPMAERRMVAEIRGSTTP